MTVTTYNPPHQFLVSSTTREEVEHIVDLSNENKPECSCEWGLEFKRPHESRMCKHIEAALAAKNGQRIERKPGDSPFLLFQCRTHD